MGGANRPHTTGLTPGIAVTGSILDCICGSETFSLEEAWEAAAMAGLTEDIKGMPMGMHTVLSDGGGTVSGGQRQRLMIAQALIRQPTVTPCQDQAQDILKFLKKDERIF